MSKYIYIKDEQCYAILPTFKSDTLHDQQEAFDRLRKETAVDCGTCKGAARIIFPNEDRIGGNGKPICDNIYVCCRCEGEGELCAYCGGNSKQCNCGN